MERGEKSLAKDIEDRSQEDNKYYSSKEFCIICETLISIYAKL